MLCWPVCASDVDLIGRASVIDGDTLEIHGQRVRLFGIDKRESRMQIISRRPVLVESIRGFNYAK